MDQIKLVTQLLLQIDKAVDDDTKWKCLLYQDDWSLF